MSGDGMPLPVRRGSSDTKVLEGGTVLTVRRPKDLKKPVVYRQFLCTLGGGERGGGGLLPWSALYRMRAT